MGRASVEAERAMEGSNIEVAKLSVFNREIGRVGGFIIIYRLYLRMQMRGATVKEQIQWVLSYMQGGLADVWKKNLLEDLETEEAEFGSAGEFLLELKIMEKFVQESWRVVKDSRYKGRALVKEFKRGMNGTIRRKLMEIERPLTSIDQWYKYATNLNRYWRKSKRKEKRIRGQ